MIPPTPDASERRPFRILFVADGFDVGGAQRALLDLLRRLDPATHRRVIFSTGVEGPLTADYRAASERIVSRPKRWKFDVPLIPALRRLIREERPDVILSVLFYADVMAGFAGRSERAPIVSWQHVVPSRDVKNRRFYHRIAFRLANPSFARIVCCSDAVKQDMTATYGVDPARMVTIHNGVDLARFSFRPLPADRAGFTIGMVARFGPEKGHAVLLRALRDARAAIPGVRLVLVGDGPTRPATEELARRLGVADAVDFRGTVVGVEELYPSFDLAVLPSDCEAHPISLLEAMACGRAVAASDVPGIREAVGEAGAGVLFPPGDAGALGRVLADLARDRGRLAEMGRAARAHVEANFELGRQQGKLIDLLRAEAGAQGAAAVATAGTAAC